MLPIHDCMRAQSENEILRRRIIRIEHERKKWKAESLRLGGMLNNIQTAQDRTKRSIETQTDSDIVLKKRKHVVLGTVSSATNMKKDSAIEQLSTQLKQSKEFQLTIAETLKNLVLSVQKVSSSAKKAASAQNSPRFSSTPVQTGNFTSAHLPLQMDKSKTAPHSKKSYDELQYKLKKLSRDKSKLKNELKWIDPQFFVEIESLKAALAESVKLNNNYQATLDRLVAKNTPK